MTICCFAGHGNAICDSEIKNKIHSKCRELITSKGINEFWIGNYGNFDRLSAEIIRQLKQSYFISLNLVIPYLTNEINEHKEYYYKNYDNIIIAQIPTNTPQRYGILKCNQYMVDKSKYMIAYVNNSFGGAAKTLEYANRKEHIKIFNFGELK